MCLSFCLAAVNITRARFSGTDEFGYTSFAAYSNIPSLGFFYEFQLKFTLANHSSALKDNLILFAGQKGQGQQPAIFRGIMFYVWPVMLVPLQYFNENIQTISVYISAKTKAVAIPAPLTPPIHFIQRQRYE